jgi:hypothetical protein
VAQATSSFSAASRGCITPSTCEKADVLVRHSWSRICVFKRP